MPQPEANQSSGTRSPNSWVRNAEGMKAAFARYRAKPDARCACKGGAAVSRGKQIPVCRHVLKEQAAKDSECQSCEWQRGFGFCSRPCQIDAARQYSAIWERSPRFKPSASRCVAGAASKATARISGSVFAMMRTRFVKCGPSCLPIANGIPTKNRIPLSEVDFVAV